MRWLVPFSFLLPLTFTTAAFADGDPKCPPGSWFCESITVGPDGVSGGLKRAPDADADTDVATTPDDTPPAAGRTRRPRVEGDGPEVADGGDPDTVVIVKKRRRRGERVVVVRDGQELPAGVRRVRKAKPWREHFGLQLRVEGAAFVARRHDEVSGMGGAGASFRWRPSPYFAFDLGADIVGGNDWNNNGRVEFSGALSGLLYFNPQHRVQVYAIGGIHLSHAEVESYCAMTDYGYGYDYYAGCPGSQRNYFGGQAGLGLEFRIARHFGMFADALGIIRTRVDSDSPEFTDPNTGATTNTSGAMLFRTGVNFWW